jgi:hypothetical protein
MRQLFSSLRALCCAALAAVAISPPAQAADSGRTLPIAIEIAGTGMVSTVPPYDPNFVMTVHRRRLTPDVQSSACPVESGITNFVYVAKDGQRRAYPALHWNPHLGFGAGVWTCVAKSVDGRETQFLVEVKPAQDAPARAR